MGHGWSICLLSALLCFASACSGTTSLLASARLPVLLPPKTANGVLLALFLLLPFFCSCFRVPAASSKERLPFKIVFSALLCVLESVVSGAITYIILMGCRVYCNVCLPIRNFVGCFPTVIVAAIRVLIQDNKSASCTRTTGGLFPS